MPCCETSYTLCSGSTHLCALCFSIRTRQSGSERQGRCYVDTARLQMRIMSTLLSAGIRALACSERQSRCYVDTVRLQMRIMSTLLSAGTRALVCSERQSRCYVDTARPRMRIMSTLLPAGTRALACKCGPISTCTTTMQAWCPCQETPLKWQSHSPELCTWTAPTR